jgi:aryl-alcohol dehydrogenase-like predicted oxidoreductase
MKTRKLGRSDLEVPVVCFGAYAIGGGYWGATDDAQAEDAVRAALDAGMFAFDTAPVYGFGHSERVLGRALAGRRSEAVVMTKVGIRWDGSGGRGEREMVGPGGEKRSVRRDSSPASVRLEVERSLERLGVERVDLVQVHAHDPATPVAETMGALAELRSEGKLRAIGVSNYPVAALEEARAALGDVPLASDQPGYSLLARGIERDVVPWSRAHGVGLLVYAPLEQGLLTGKVTPERSFGAEEGRPKKALFRPENLRRVNAVLDSSVAPVARAHDATIAQVVIAWTVAQPGITAALVGARHRGQVAENARAGEIELTADERAEIERAFAGLRLDLRSPLAARLRGFVCRLLGR